MASVRKLNKLLDKPCRSLTVKEWKRVERWFPDEFAWLMVRLRSRPGECMTTALEEFDLRLNRRYPYSLDYYRAHAEASRNRREMADRLATSSPFKVSVGTRR